MSRASIVGMLVALELLIAGTAMYVVGAGGHWHTWSNGHAGAFAPTPIAPLSLGAAPHVVIDDANSAVLLTTSSDGLVHVTDLTRREGWTFGHLGHLRAQRTADGVRIERSGTTSNWNIGVIGFVDEKIQVAVPSQSHVDVLHCSGAEISGVAGATTVHSDDGRIRLSQLGGTIGAFSADGSIEATDVNASTLSMRSSDGHIALRRVVAGTLTASTSDGSISGNAVTVGAGTSNELSTGDGSIRLSLAPDSNLVVTASTADGEIVVDGTRYAGDDSSDHTVRLGNGAGSLKLATADGSIHLDTKGV